MVLHWRGFEELVTNVWSARGRTFGLLNEETPLLLLLPSAGAEAAAAEDDDAAVGVSAWRGMDALKRVFKGNILTFY